MSAMRDKLQADCVRKLEDIQPAAVPFVMESHQRTELVRLVFPVMLRVWLLIALADLAQAKAVRLRPRRGARGARRVRRRRAAAEARPTGGLGAWARAEPARRDRRRRRDVDRSGVHLNVCVHPLRSLPHPSAFCPVLLEFLPSCTYKRLGSCTIKLQASRLEVDVVCVY
jgi:hypothetical protein